MNNFEFYNPVKILFGEGKIADICKEIPPNSKVLVTYGGGSIKRNGVYNQVMQALKGFEVFEFEGIEANPRFETLIKAVALAKENSIDFLLAVGGGSVIDGTKFISAAIPFKDDPWLLLTGGKSVVIERTVPFGTVLTLPATGSEMNSGSVISRESTKEKFAFGSPLLFPSFSVLDPTTTYSLPKNQIVNGIIDAFVHVTEQYITYPVYATVQDKWAEGLLQTLIEIGPKAIANPLDYDTRSNIMWSCTMALNGIIGVGVPTDWSTHMIGHELTALLGLDHAVTLAIVLPSLLREAKDEKREKLLQYAEKVWSISSGDEDFRIEMAIENTEQFFRSLGVATKLSEYGVAYIDLTQIPERFTQRRWKLGERRSITPERVERIIAASI